VASDSRALTLKLLADTADFQKKLSAGSKDIDSIGERAAEFGKKAAVAFAAAGAAIGAFAVSAIKAAAEDETAQKRLADTITATTGATAKQIEGVEEYIKQTSIAIGVADDGLRPAFTRLIRSTQDTEEAQKLLNLALDLSAATGKPLEAVTNALGRAYDGNTVALGRLGLGIDKSDLASQTFDETFQQLTSTFGQFAENEAETTTKQMERVKIALDEAKESIGAALLPVVQDLTSWILQNFIPALEAFISGLTGQDGLEDSLTDTENKFVSYGKTVRKFIDTVIDLKDEILIVGAVMLGVFTANKIAAGVTAIITLITTLRKALNALKASALIAGVAQAFALNPLLGVGAVALGAAVLAGATALFSGDDTTGERPDLFFPGGGAGVGTSGAGKRASGNEITGFSYDGRMFNTEAELQAYIRSKSGTGSTGTTGTTRGTTATTTAAPTLIEQVSEANFIKNIAGTGSFDVAGFRQAEERGNVIINVNAPSVIDEEGFSRAIILALNNSQRRTGAGASQLND
jgi:hypothetical protein